ncbi:MAG TPA: hypothetical protein VFA86_02685 [Gammaproteobacteria bacterium]|nr:hypothetical protein [Gammaproteobacteria bacterium]
MTLFNLDGPLNREQVRALGRLLERSGIPGCLDPVRQRRLPVPMPRSEQRSLQSRPLSQQVDLVRRRLSDAGLMADDDEVFALLLPRRPFKATAALALALGDVAGRAPRLVARGGDGGRPLRLIDTGRLLDWLRHNGRRTRGRAGAGWRRGVSR